MAMMVILAPFMFMFRSVFRTLMTFDFELGAVVIDGHSRHIISQVSRTLLCQANLFARSRTTTVELAQYIGTAEPFSREPSGAYAYLAVEFSS